VKRPAIELTPMIAVRDVERSVAWYQSLIGCTSDHGGAEFDRLMDGTRTLLLLHRWGAPEHASLREGEPGPTGNGLILWFQVDDLDAVWARAQALGARVVDPPQLNAEAGHREFSVADPDGYVVAVCAITG